MNEEVWRKIMKEYIKIYDEITHLNEREIIIGDDAVQIWMNLLEDIICTFKSEVEE